MRQGRKWQKRVEFVKVTAKMSIIRIEIPQIIDQRISESSQRAKIVVSLDQRKGLLPNLERGSNLDLGQKPEFATHTHVFADHDRGIVLVVYSKLKYIDWPSTLVMVAKSKLSWFK